MLLRTSILRFGSALILSTKWSWRLLCNSNNILHSNAKWDAFVPSDRLYREDQIPKQSDVVIIGGGVVGWAVAFWLRWTSKYSVTLIERDPTYSHSATVLGLGSIRQQFSEPENIQMSLFGSEFLRNVKDYLSVLDDTQLDIEFNPQGCLMLANLELAESLERNYRLQLDLGAKVQLFSHEALAERWPWLNLEDIELGCFGYENEGWFDPWLLLKALRAKCHVLGVNYVVGEVIDFESSPHMTTITFHDMPQRVPVTGRMLREVVLALPDGSKTSITFGMVVNAAGPWASNVAKLAEIGSEQIPIGLPVEPRARHMFVIRPNHILLASQSSDRRISRPQLPGLDAPFIIDPNRIFVERRELSGEFIVYTDDPRFDSVDKDVSENFYELDVDYDLFKRELDPLLSHRIPALSKAQISSAWTAVCDYNTWDQNLIIGHHPYHVNMYFCNGSSGHGTQHAIAIGRAVCELIIYGHFKTIDLTRFSFDRLHLNQMVKETNAF